MKTSKLLLLTFAGLLFCIMTVTIDLNNRGQLISFSELPTTAKSCLQKYFPNKTISYAKVKEKIVSTTYEMGQNYRYDAYDCDDMLAYSGY